MDFRDKSTYSLNSKVLTLIVIGILILVNILSVRYFVRFDLTENKKYSISDSTVSILHDLEDLVTVKAYFTSDLPAQFLPTKQYLKDILSEYEAYGSGNFDYEFVDPDESTEDAQEAQRIGVQQVRMQVRENDSFQVKNGYLGLGIFYEGKNDAIPVIQQENLGNLEYDLTSMIIKMAQPRALVVGFLQGHGEHELSSAPPFPGAQSSSDYQAVSQVLAKNYEVKAIDFTKQDTLEGVDMLVVAGAKRDLTDRDVFEIDQYLLQGGKAIFLIDGILQLADGISLQVLDTNLKTLFEPMGVIVESDLMLDNLSELTNFSEGPGRFFFLQYPPFIRLVSDNFSDHPVVAKIQSFVMRFVSSVTVNEIESLSYDKFVSTSPNSWHQEAPFQVDPTSIPPATLDQAGARSVAVAVSGLFPRISSAENVPALQRWEVGGEEGYELKFVEKDDNRKGRKIIKEAQAEAGIIIVSDSDFISDRFLQNDQSALVVFLNMVDSLVLGDELINIRSKSLGGANIGELENSEKALMKFLGILLVPILVSGYGVFRLWARRKEEKLLKL